MANKADGLKKKFNRLEYEVCFLGATEAPFTGRYWSHFERGLYQCVVCGNTLFSSQNKLRSKSGWPTFSQGFDETSLFFKDDNSHGMQRIEVSCQECGSHLGHVFDEESTPIKRRFCINSASLKFVKNNR